MMSKNIKQLIWLLFVGFTFNLHAQTTFYLDGYGRVVTTNDRLSGEIIENDTTNANKGAGGYTLFDLGANIEKENVFRVNSILRVRNEFGRFFGDGVSFEFRQLRFEGIIGKGIKYEIGDIDVEMTPFTVHNYNYAFHDFEADAFRIRREIQEYENFNFGNAWRLQGVQSYGSLLFSKGVEKIAFKGFATRTNPVNDIGNPDRVFSGFSANIKQSKYFSLGLNYAGFLDLELSTTRQKYSNDVLTTTLGFNYDLEKIDLFLDAELGSSQQNYNNQITGVNLTKEDYFYDAKVGAKHRELGIKAQVGLRDVGADFTSPGAQTRRMMDNNYQLQYFNNTQFGERNQLVFDRATQEYIYNRSLSSFLQGYNPAYNNVTPYGDATPNRRGLVADVTRSEKDKAWGFRFRYLGLSEIVADGNSDNELRNFTAIQTGAAVNVDNLLDWKKQLKVTVGYSSEQTTRGGRANIDLNSSTIDLGTTIEVFPSFDLMLGYRIFAAKGTEYLLETDASNPTPALAVSKEYDFSENLIAIGARFRFSDLAAVSATFNQSSFKNNASIINDNYNFNQLFLNYTMQF